MHPTRIAIIALLTLLLTTTAAHAGKLTCLTGTDPSVANDAYQLALARSILIGFNFDCPCGSFDGSPGKTHADWMHCLKMKDAAGALVRTGYIRPQCKSTLLKQANAATCGYASSLTAAPCVKKSLAGKVTCAIKPSAQCVDKPGKFSQLTCAWLDCVEAADANGDGRISAGDSGACAAPVCGNGVREGFEQCDPPGATCADGEVCTKSCYCAVPTKTRTPTLAPGQSTNTPTPPPPSSTPTRTPVLGQPTNTSTPAPRFVDNGDGTL